MLGMSVDMSGEAMFVCARVWSKRYVGDPFELFNQFFSSADPLSVACVSQQQCGRM